MGRGLAAGPASFYSGSIRPHRTAPEDKRRCEGEPGCYFFFFAAAFFATASPATASTDAATRPNAGSLEFT